MKPGPPPPAGGEAPWDGGKRSVKERETETTPASRKSPVMDVSRQARVVWVSSDAQNSEARVVWVSTSPKTARQGWPGFQPAPKTARQGRPRFHTRLLEQRSGRAGPTQRPHSPAWSAARPAITPWTHHPACLLPFRLIAHWHRVDEVSHSPGMHTPLTSHGAARSCSRRVEVLRLARLLDTPGGSLRLTQRENGGVFAPAGSDPYTW